MKKDVPGKRVTREAETNFKRLYEKKVRQRAVSLFPVVRRAKRETRKWHARVLKNVDPFSTFSQPLLEPTVLAHALIVLP